MRSPRYGILGMTVRRKYPKAYCKKTRDGFVILTSPSGKKLSEAHSVLLAWSLANDVVSLGKDQTGESPPQPTDR
jgi:hypothetical protein